MHMRTAIFAACLLAAPLAAPAEQANVSDIVKQMKKTLEPAKVLRKVRITIKTDGESVRWSAAEASKMNTAGPRLVMVLLDPPDIRGTAVLVADATDQVAPVWVYMPSIRRVRKLVGSDAYEHFLGTDFTFADLGFVRLASTYKLLGEEEKAGHQTYKIEETRPTDRALYSRIVIWVTKDTHVPVAREYYDLAGDLWKTETIESTLVDQVPTALHVVMTDVQAKETTEMDISAISYEAPIPDSLFDPDKLRDAVDSPVWNAVGGAPAANK